MKKVTELQNAIDKRAYELARKEAYEKHEEMEEIFNSVSESFQISIGGHEVWSDELLDQIETAMEKVLFEQIVKQEIHKLVNPTPKGNIRRRA